EQALGANAAVDLVYRSDWGRIVATLIRLVGDFDVAEEAAQEAFATAVDQWPVSGVPDVPRAWIIQTARHKAIDRIRRRARFAEKLDAYARSEERRVGKECEARWAAEHGREEGTCRRVRARTIE